MIKRSNASLLIALFALPTIVCLMLLVAAAYPDRIFAQNNTPIIPCGPTSGPTERVAPTFMLPGETPLPTLAQTPSVGQGTTGLIPCTPTSESEPLSAMGKPATRTPTPTYTFTPTSTPPTWVVNKLADTNDGVCDSADCSLREAIASALYSVTITFAANLPGLIDPVSGNPGTISLTQGQLPVNTYLTIAGPSSGEITLSGNDTSRIFYATGQTFNLSDLTLANGNDTSGSGGGAIYNAPNGPLNITRVVFRNNRSSGAGGAIYNRDRSVTISQSTFINNIAGASGGAIDTGGIYGCLTITDSTFTTNTAPTGGAITNRVCTDVIRSTFDRNSSLQGGAIYNYVGPGPFEVTHLNVANSTFTNNTASNQGLALFFGGAQFGANNWAFIVNTTFFSATSNARAMIYETLDPYVTISLRNTLLASQPSSPNCGGPLGLFIDNGNNFDSGSTCGFPTERSNVNPLLDAAGLKDNGGPTHTIALQPLSPAIDAGNDTACAQARVDNVDQRGSPRPIGAACDVGAFELNAFKVNIIDDGTKAWQPDETQAINDGVLRIGQAFDLVSANVNTPQEAFNRVMPENSGTEILFIRTAQSGSVTINTYRYLYGTLRGQVVPLTYTNPGIQNGYCIAIQEGVSGIVRLPAAVICSGDLIDHYYGTNRTGRASVYTAVHELGHIFDYRTGNGLSGPIGGIAYGGGTRFELLDCDRNVVMGDFSVPVWARGRRGWGTGPSHYLVNNNPVPLITDFQENPENIPLEAAADSFLNWVFRWTTSMAQAVDPCILTPRPSYDQWAGPGLLNLEWDAAAPDFIANSAGSPGTPDASLPGDRRYLDIDGRIRQIFTTNGW